MARLPTPGGDDGTWGTVLNDYLSQSIDTDGTLKVNTVGNGQLASSAVTDAKVSATAAIAQSKIANLTTDLAGKIPMSLIDAKGDLIVATAADTVARLPLGTDGQVLTADSVQTSGVKWANPSAGHTIEDEVIALTQRTKLSFQGPGVTATDDAANDRTVVTVPGYTAPSSSSVRAYASGTQTITTATYTDVAFDSESYDTASMHDLVTNNARITISTSGYYAIAGSVRFGASTAGNNRAVFIYKNNTTFLAQSWGAVTSDGTQHVSDIAYLSAGDYITLQVYQDTGANLSLYGGADITFLAANLIGGTAAGISYMYGSIDGALGVIVGTSRMYNDSGRSLTIKSIRATLGTTPAGQSVIVDINKNGTTLFTTQANRPTIAPGNYSSKVASMDILTIADGEYLTVDVDQTGSTVAGSDLTVQIEVIG